LVDQALVNDKVIANIYLQYEYVQILKLNYITSFCFCYKYHRACGWINHKEDSTKIKKVSLTYKAAPWNK